MRLSSMIKQLNESLVALGDVEIETRRIRYHWDNGQENEDFVDERITGLGNDGEKIYILNQNDDEGLWI